MQLQSSGFRTWHRWLSVVVGVQMVIWSISGAYMVLIKLPFIHGEHLTRQADGVLADSSKIAVLPQVLQIYPDAYDVRLVNRYIVGEYQDLVQVHLPQRKFLLDTDTLTPIELTAEDIRALAKAYYDKGEPVIRRVELLRDAAPGELNPVHLPIWRVDFDDFGNTSLYLHRETGEMTVRRHDFWRGFDIMWMLHIMDYKDRVDITTWWLRGFIFATFLFAFTGTVLLLQTIWLSRRRVR